MKYDKNFDMFILQCITNIFIPVFLPLTFFIFWHLIIVLEHINILFIKILLIIYNIANVYIFFVAISVITFSCVNNFYWS